MKMVPSSQNTMISSIFHLSLWALLDTAIFYPKLLLQNLFPTLIGVSGQLYVAIIISMLIGKFSSTSNQSKQ
jgi:hypothetical protein